MKVVTQLCQHFVNRQDKPLTSSPRGEGELFKKLLNQSTTQPSPKPVHESVQKCSRAA
jgi:hypothetical protein